MILETVTVLATLPDFNTDATAPPGAEILQTFINWLMYIGYAIGIIGFVGGAIILMLAAFRGHQSNAGGKLLMVGLGVILLTSAVPLTRALMGVA